MKSRIIKRFAITIYEILSIKYIKNKLRYYVIKMLKRNSSKIYYRKESKNARTSLSLSF